MQVGLIFFSDQFRKIIKCDKYIGFNVNVMRRSACLVVNAIAVNNIASLFNCTQIRRASVSVMNPV